MAAHFKYPTSKEIEEIIQQGENLTVEFKSNISQPSLLAKTIAAFAKVE